jgi:phosphoglycerol transferase MdoB-like AlkP superfamily enzyme
MKKILQRVPDSAKWTVLFFMLDLSLFSLCRAAFFFFCTDTNSTGQNEAHAFIRGVEFDISVCSWISFLPLLLGLIYQVLPGKAEALLKMIRIWLLSISSVCLFICVADIPYFRQFGNHFGKQALLWNNNPLFVVKLIFSTSAYWGFLFLFFVFLMLVILFGKKILRQKISTTSRFTGVAIHLLFIVLAIAGARGRITERTALHQGHAIVSENAFVNQLALNPNFIFWSDLISGENSEYKVPHDIDSSFAFAQDYLGLHRSNERDLKRTCGNSVSSRPNVVIVIMESMCLFKMGYYNGKKLTPQFDSLIRESLFFSNFFSCGIHTFNGIYSTITGRPGIPGEHLLENFATKPFGGLGEIFRQRGYTTRFYTTHDPHFDNMKGFSTVNGFEHFISQDDFSSEEVEGTLGVPDHVLFDKFLAIGDAEKKKPFLSVLLTSSDHGPWYVPANIPFKPNGENEREKATLYADWAVGRFMKMAKLKTWYANTIFFFLGDHGLSMGHTYEMPLSFHHVPFVIHGKVVKPDTNVYPGSQADVLATVMGFVGGEYTDRSMGLDLTRSKHEFSIFSADNKRGCVDSLGNYYYETDEGMQKYLRRYQQLDPKNYYPSEKKYADSLAKKMKALFDCEEYLLREAAKVTKAF